MQLRLFLSMETRLVATVLEDIEVEAVAHLEEVLHCAVLLHRDREAWRIERGLRHLSAPRRQLDVWQSKPVQSQT